MHLNLIPYDFIIIELRDFVKNVPRLNIIQFEVRMAVSRLR